LLSGLLLGLRCVEFAEDVNVGIVKKTRVRFHAFCGLLAAFEDTEIMGKEANSVLQCGAGIVMFEIMSFAAGYSLNSTILLARG
jgi:hypothetical protein